METAQGKPLYIDPFSNIPPEMKTYSNWVCGRAADKSPVNPKTGGNAMVNVPSTWGTFAQALKYYEAHKHNGIGSIGFAVNESPFTGIDLDHCRNAETGEIELWALEIIKALDTYTEVSPSGTGIRMFVTDDLPPTNKKKGNIEIANGGTKKGKYFSITGNHLEGTPTWVCNRPKEIRLIFDKYFAPEKEPPKVEAKLIQKVNLADDELLKKAFDAENGAKFKALWEGDFSSYQSQSEADQALCCHLAFYTGRGAVRIDALFRQSGLMREKWNRDDYRTQTIKRAIEVTKEVHQERKPESVKPCQAEFRLTFPDIMTGLAGEFAKLYSSYLEAPEHFFFINFLTCLGAVLANRLTLQNELQPQPRLYTLNLGESADDRKSTAQNKTIEFFRMALEDFPVCFGVGSAEGLQKRLEEKPSLLLVFDEFKQFISKCKIESSVLLPCVNTLFESNFYESRTKTSDIKLDNVYLSLLAASTVATYERTWDASFTDIGFNNRLFIVPGSGQKRFSFPQKISEDKKRHLVRRLGEVLKSVGSFLELEIEEEAKDLYHNWYMNLPRSIHTKRLDTYSMRFMTLFTINDGKTIVDAETIDKTTRFMNWQLQARILHDPIDSDTKMGKMEEKIRRALSTGPKTERQIKQLTHANREGIWFFQTAKQNLLKTQELFFGKKEKTWRLAE